MKTLNFSGMVNHLLFPKLIKIPDLGMLGCIQIKKAAIYLAAFFKKLLLLFKTQL